MYSLGTNAPGAVANSVSDVAHVLKSSMGVQFTVPARQIMLGPWHRLGPAHYMHTCCDRKAQSYTPAQGSVVQQL